VRRGTFTPVVMRQHAAGGRVLRSGFTRPVQSSAIIQRPSPQTMVGPKRRLQAALRLGGGFRGLVLRRSCNAVGPASEGLSRLAALVVLLREGKVATPQKGMARASANSQAPHAQAGRAETRESDARECDRASEVSCRSRWAAVGSREAPVGASREQREARRWAGTGI
jgi:hypothetical protein